MLQQSGEKERKKKKIGSCDTYQDTNKNNGGGGGGEGALSSFYVYPALIRPSGYWSDLWGKS